MSGDGVRSSVRSCLAAHVAARDHDWEGDLGGIIPRWGLAGDV